jgi:hypothetical protein
MLQVVEAPIIPALKTLKSQYGKITKDTKGRSREPESRSQEVGVDAGAGRRNRLISDQS